MLWNVLLVSTPIFMGGWVQSSSVFKVGNRSGLDEPHWYQELALMLV